MTDCKVLTPKQAGLLFPSAVAVIGNLDGVHLGHVALVEEAKSLASQLDSPLVAISFEPHPKRYFDPNCPQQRLSPSDYKAELLGELGVQALINVPFVTETATMLAEDFVTQLLMECIRVKALVAGPDFRFGKQRKGDLVLASQLGLIVKSIVWQQHNGEIISSSKIRQALLSGDLAMANQLLNRSYQIRGEVEMGDQLGRSIGFPTANINTNAYCVPANGIYAAWTDIGDGHKPRATALYVGKRPAIDGEEQRFEAHLLDFDGDLYGREIKVCLEQRIRGDMALDGLDALKTQIERDCAACRSVLT